MPRNPLVRTTRTTRPDEPRGHASWSRRRTELVVGLSWLRRTAIGRWGAEALLDPIEWTADGWFRMTGGDLSQPIRKPGGGALVPHGRPCRTTSGAAGAGAEVELLQAVADGTERAHAEAGTLVLQAVGQGAGGLVAAAADRRRPRAMNSNATSEIAPGGTAGLVLFYDEKLYCGLGFDEKRFVTHQYGMERGRPANPYGRRLRTRVSNRQHIVAFHSPAMAGRPGSASIGGWKCPVTITMCAAAS